MSNRPWTVRRGKWFEESLLVERGTCPRDHELHSRRKLLRNMTHLSRGIPLVKQFPSSLSLMVIIIGGKNSFRVLTLRVIDMQGAQFFTWIVIRRTSLLSVENFLKIYALSKIRDSRNMEYCKSESVVNKQYE